MKIKFITTAAIILAGVIVAVTTISTSVSKNNEYNGYLAKARENAENQIPYIACQNYNKAFQIKCEDESVYEEYLKQTKALGDGFYETAIKDYVVKFPLSKKAYEELCTYYYEEKNYNSVISTALEANEKAVSTEKIKKLYLECFCMPRKTMTGLEEAGTFLGDYALVKRDGLYGYVNSSGSYQITPMYKAASPMLDGSAAVNDGKEWFIINGGGFKIARPKGKVDYLSFLSNGLITIGKDGKYSYTSTNLGLPEKLAYDYASNFKNQVAAVKKGEKWAIVNAEGKAVTDYNYDDIILDEFNTCINNGVIFAKESGKYYMLDSSGNKISKQGFDDAYPFVGTEPAAVCVEGKWGFVTVEGEIVIEPKYTKAKSFNIGLAPVCENGVWYYIDSSGEKRIEETYSDAKPFSSHGMAAVKENNMWSYIKLLGYSN